MGVMKTELQGITVTSVLGALSVRSERGGLDKKVDRHAWGLSFCRDGQITYIQNGIEYVADRHRAVLLPKGGTYVIKRDKTGDFFLINFDCLDLFCDTITLIPIENVGELIADYERIKKLSCFEENRAQIFSVFYGMLHKLHSGNIPCELQGAVRLINGSYCDPTLTNARLAAECKISEVYFRKLFTAHFGTSPKQFILDMRIQRARQLLTEGALGVVAVAEACGFSSPYHFCRLFKQKTGTTPSEYRKANLVHGI